MRPILTLLVIFIVVSSCQRLEMLKQAGEKVKKTACVCVSLEASREEGVCPYNTEAAKQSSLTEVRPTLINIVESKFDPS